MHLNDIHQIVFRHVNVKDVSQSKYISAVRLVQQWVYSFYCNGLVPQSGIIVTYLRQFRFLSHMTTANLTWDPLVTLDSTADSVRKSHRPVHPSCILSSLPLSQRYPYGAVFDTVTAPFPWFLLVHNKQDSYHSKVCVSLFQDFHSHCARWLSMWLPQPLWLK